MTENGRTATPDEVVPLGETFQQRLKRLRTSRGLTIGQIGSAIGVTKAAVCRWEGGRAMPRRHYIDPLAALLGISIPELMLGVSLHSGRAPNLQRNEPLDDLIKGIRSRVERCRIIAKRMDPEAAESLIQLADEGEAAIAALIATREVRAAA